MSTAQPAPDPVIPQSLALVNRYSNAYFSARTMVGFGTAIKAIGIVLAVLTAVATFALDERLLIGAVLIAVAIGALFFFLGIFVSAQGEILKETLDPAVSQQRSTGTDHVSTNGSAASAMQGSDAFPKCGQPRVEIRAFSGRAEVDFPKL